MQRPDRGVLIIGLTIAGLILLAVLAALFVGSPEEETFAEGTPARTVQDYMRAVRERDRETAYDFYSDAAQRQMSFEEFSGYVGNFGFASENTRIRLEESRVEGDRATLVLRIEQFNEGSVFDSNRYDYERTVVLVREDGGWKIDEPYLYL